MVSRGIGNGITAFPPNRAQYMYVSLRAQRYSMWSRAMVVLTEGSIRDTNFI